MAVKLYGVSVSHPSHAARAMLELKGIEYELVNMPTGVHAILLRGAGFRGRTVPALKIDGRRIQGSKEISRALDEIQPAPPLFPADRRAAVEDAEAWGEREFQPLPRRFFRWGLSNVPELRMWAAKNVIKSRAPGATAAAILPMARWFARLSRADDDYTREGVAKLPGALDHVDELIAEGTIGREDEPTAADYQIASTVAVLRGFADVKELVEDRPAAELAGRLFPRRLAGLPPFLPEEWLEPVRTVSPPSANPPSAIQ